MPRRRSISIQAAHDLIEIIHERVRNLTEATRLRNAQQYDKARRSLVLNVGDKVLLYDPARPSKLNVSYTGPHLVTATTENPNIYLVTANGQSKRYHISRIIPYDASRDPDDIAAPVSPNSTGYTITEVLEHRYAETDGGLVLLLRFLSGSACWVWFKFRELTLRREQIVNDYMLRNGLAPTRPPAKLAPAPSALLPSTSPPPPLPSTSPPPPSPPTAPPPPGTT